MAESNLSEYQFRSWADIRVQICTMEGLDHNIAEAFDVLQKSLMAHPDPYAIIQQMISALIDLGDRHALERIKAN